MLVKYNVFNASGFGEGHTPPTRPNEQYEKLSVFNDSGCVGGDPPPTRLVQTNTKHIMFSMLLEMAGGTRPSPDPVNNMKNRNG